MKQLGIGLSDAERHEDALSVQEAELSMLRRLGASEVRILGAQSNLAIRMDAWTARRGPVDAKRDVYSGRLRLAVEEHRQTS